MTSTIVVFALYFVAVIGLTVYASRQLNAKGESDFSTEYFVGGRTLGPVALAILVAAGICSTGTFLGGPSLNGLYGPGFGLLMGLGQIPMNLFILGVLGKKANIIGRRTNAETYIDIFRYRYENYKPLIFALLVTILIFLTAAAVAEFTGASRVIQAMTGIPFVYSLVAFGIIITLYTALGGLKGVSIVAMLQGLIMTVASVILVVGYIRHFNGITPVFTELRAIDPLLMTPGGPEAMPMIGMLGLWLTYGIGTLGLPWAVQSTLGYDSTKNMKLAIAIGVVFVAFWSIFITNWGGAAGRAFAPNLEIPDFNIPTLAEGTLPAGLSGIMLAAIAGAGQSTIAALFILASGSIIVNIHRAFIKPDASEHQVKRLSLGVTAGIGIVTVLLSLNPPPAMQFIITFSAGGAAASLICPLVLGLFWPRANKHGAFGGVVLGLAGYLLFSQVDLGIEILRTAPLVFAFALSALGTVGISLVTKAPSPETLRVYFGAEYDDPDRTPLAR